MKFYIARNTLAVTMPMTKKACLELFAKESARTDFMPGKYQLCREEYDMLNPTVVMDLN